LCRWRGLYGNQKYVKNAHCSGCTKYLLCVGFRNAQTKCPELGTNSMTASDTAMTIASFNTDNGGNFYDYMKNYLNASYNSAAVSSGLNGEDCLALYGSYLGCKVPIFRSAIQKKPVLDPSDDINPPHPYYISCNLPITLL